MRAFVFFFINLLTFFSFAGGFGLSAKRYFYEDFDAARNRNLAIRIDLENTASHSPRAFPLSRSASDVRTDISKIVVSEVPALASEDELKKYFVLVRDTRFIQSRSQNFPRRPTWLYPDDGCYARAEVAKIEMLESNLIQPKKMFAFGNLIALTQNAPSGYVRWWYHVALAYRVNEQIFIIDPALDATRPLKLNDWNKLIGGSKTKTRFSLCSPETFGPEDDCQERVGPTKAGAISTQEYFFPYEWDRLLELGRNPEAELGDSPPWL